MEGARSRAVQVTLENLMLGTKALIISMSLLKPLLLGHHSERLASSSIQMARVEIARVVRGEWINMT